MSFYDTVVLADAPIRYYHMNESSGSTMVDSGSQLVNGTYNNSPTLGATGLISVNGDTDTAVQFAHASSQFATVPTTGLPTGASAFTVEILAKIISPVASGGTVFYMGTLSGTNQAVTVESSTGPSWSLFIWNGTGFTANVAYGQVTQLAITYNGTTISYFVNGVPIGSTVVTLAIAYGAFQLGAGDTYFNGVLGKCAIYNKALTQDRLACHYNAATFTTTPGISIFPSDNIWNRPITDLPVHASSSTWITTLGSTSTINGGTPWGPPATNPFTGLPYEIVHGNSQPLVAINVTGIPSQSDSGPAPIPPSAQRELYNTDNHVLVLDVDNMVLHEMESPSRNSDNSWTCYTYAKWPLTDALRTNGWTSADAAGLPMFSGVIRYDEVASGAINHALRCAVPLTHGPHLWPARHDADTGSTSYPPLGARLRLKASYSLAGYGPQNTVILQALKTYGAFVADNGAGAGTFNIYFAPDPRWNASDLGTGPSLTLASFDFIDESGAQVSANSGQAFQPTYFTQVTKVTFRDGLVQVGGR